MKKYFNRRCLFIFSTIAILLAVGCAVRMLDFTVISSKNVDMRVKDTAKGARVTGEDMAMSILGIIPLGAPNLKEALDKAIESAGPGYDALIDGVIYHKYNFYVFFSNSGYKVEGTPIKTKEIISQLKEKGEYVGKYMEEALYHSSSGIDNTKAIEKIGIIKVIEEKKE
jgi:hypothetical protein